MRTIQPRFPAVRFRWKQSAHAGGGQRRHPGGQPAHPLYPRDAPPSQSGVGLAAHARTHPDAQLQRRWSAARCQQAGAFANRTLRGDRVDAQALAYRPTVRPDGHGIFTEHHATTSFFLEYDTGTEPVTRLVAKLHSYHQLARVSGNLWPVLFGPFPIL
jgi:hypothetical protein